MREIKFRAWDKIGKIMIDWPVNVYTDEEGPWWSADHIGETGNTIASFDGKTGVLMQFTGLFDKNGKEIYEGDIFNYKYDKRAEGGGYIAGTYGYHPENAQVVEYRNGCFMVGHESLYDFVAFSKLPGHGKEVIGDIYSNPELLK
jgi:uncharacterized phage protein (TIGR01671 family)